MRFQAMLVFGCVLVCTTISFVSALRRHDLENNVRVQLKAIGAEVGWDVRYSAEALHEAARLAEETYFTDTAVEDLQTAYGVFKIIKFKRDSEHTLSSGIQSKKEELLTIIKSHNRRGSAIVCWEFEPSKLASLFSGNPQVQLIVVFKM